MVQDDSYYINLGYEYARQRKALDILHEEKQDLPVEAIRVKRELEEADKVTEQRKRIKRAVKKAHYTFKHMHDHDHDRPAFTSSGKVIGTIYGIPPEIDRLIKDDNVSIEEFKKMDL
jgi:hypothetical protein